MKKLINSVDNVVDEMLNGMTAAFPEYIERVPGTDAMRIQDAILRADSGDGVCVMVDLGSGIMSAETAIEFLEFDDEHAGIRVQIADAPVLEGAVSAAVSASAGDSLEEVIAAAEEARGVRKLE